MLHNEISLFTFIIDKVRLLPGKYLAYIPPSGVKLNTQSVPL